MNAALRTRLVAGTAIFTRRRLPVPAVTTRPRATIKARSPLADIFTSFRRVIGLRIQRSR